MTRPSSGSLPRESVQLTVDRLAPSGEGGAHWQGHPVLIPHAAPGDQVEVTLRRAGKRVMGTLQRLIQPGPNRHMPSCPVAGRCGGCDWLHLDDAAQLKAKVASVIQALERAGTTSDLYRLLTPVAPPPSMAYRRRATLHVGRAGISFFERGSHQSVVLQACPALVPALQSRLKALSDCLVAAHGQVSEVSLLAEGDACSAALIFAGAERPPHAELAKRILALGFQGVVLVPETGSVRMVGSPELLSKATGAPDVRLRLRPDAFAQAHREGNALLVQSALDLLRPRAEERALELFGGNGNFTFGLAELVPAVWMVEGSAVSVGLARKAADEAARARVRLLQGDVDKITQGLVSEGQRFASLLLDPPRTGFPSLSKVASGLGVERLVYVACDAQSLAHDTALLWDEGYQAEALQVFDLFPQTHHVESVMSFSRR